MKSLLDQPQVSTPNTVLGPRKSKHNLDIRLACIEDGLDNTGFRKIAAFIKSIHSNAADELLLFMNICSPNCLFIAYLIISCFVIFIP